ncbi:MAG: MoaD/ThiS family protein [Clostridium sp.]|nr:MoaD/ThiS family protein [Clostridium sp.]
MITQVKTHMTSADAFKGDLELPDDSLVENVLEQLGLSDHTNLRAQNFILLVNGKNATLSTKLSHGDQLLILQSMVGG